MDARSRTVNAASTSSVQNSPHRPPRAVAHFPPRSGRRRQCRGWEATKGLGLTFPVQQQVWESHSVVTRRVVVGVLGGSHFGTSAGAAARTEVVTEIPRVPALAAPSVPPAAHATSLRNGQRPVEDGSAASKPGAQLNPPTYVRATGRIVASERTNA
jgi:hypothetical protein